MYVHLFVSESETDLKDTGTKRDTGVNILGETNRTCCKISLPSGGIKSRTWFH